MKNRKKLVIANWKMNIGSVVEAKKLVSGVKKKISKIKKTEVVFCTSFVYLSSLQTIASKNIKLGAQNTFTEDQGSYTGEVSSIQLKQFGLSYCIVGHSERRKMGETDDMINKKTISLLKSKISPVLCIGEVVHDEDGNYLDFIKKQLKSALSGIDGKKISNVVIAYEPVWAVGGKVAMESRGIHEMSLYIKKCLRELFGNDADSVLVLYGGTVNPENAKDIMENGFVDGLLVGRDSLSIDSFSNIIKEVDSVK